MFDESSFDSQSFEETSWLFGIIPIIIAGASWGIHKVFTAYKMVKFVVVKGFTK